MADFLEGEGRAVVAYSSDEIHSILKNRGWLVGEASEAQVAWCARAAALLGPHAIAAAANSAASANAAAAATVPATAATIATTTAATIATTTATTTAATIATTTAATIATTTAATSAPAAAATAGVTAAEAMEGFLGLVFEYDASRILLSREAHGVLSRVGGREVIRMLALILIDGRALTSDSFSEFVTSVKSETDLRGPQIFHPMRLALAGRAGDGSLDRLILLLDEAAACEFSVPVKSARTRIVEFCAALG